MKPRPFALAAAVALLAGCGTPTGDKPATPNGTQAAVPKDGELPLPPDYQRWPKFLSTIQRPDLKQVREIYMNPAAQGGTAAKGFPNGSVFVMENYAALTDPDGTPKTGPDGGMFKGDLLRVFVMGKHAGWGQDVPGPLKNGHWIYSAYLAGGAKAPDNPATCRGCHAPLTGSKDFIHRYDQYFASKAASVQERGTLGNAR